MKSRVILVDEVECSSFFVCRSQALVHITVMDRGPEKSQEKRTGEAKSKRDGKGKKIDERRVWKRRREVKRREEMEGEEKVRGEDGDKEGREKKERSGEEICYMQ